MPEDSTDSAYSFILLLPPYAYQLNCWFCFFGIIPVLPSIILFSEGFPFFHDKIQYLINLDIMCTSVMTISSSSGLLYFHTGSMLIHILPARLPTSTLIGTQLYFHHYSA